MTEIEQRIAIAEARGWTQCQEHTDPTWWTNSPIKKRVYGDNEKYWPLHILPNYLESLDAMHEAERAMDCLFRKDYIANLWKVCGFEADSANFWTEYNFRGIYALLHATAKQRAEAFLKTIGKWKE